ncbi:hypothetical protein LTR85_008892 [Meristemomyces frigidus]|nr:hypothetical protein LTR85_008892 [Meristemomyces frigidus]
MADVLSPNPNGFRQVPLRAPKPSTRPSADLAQTDTIYATGTLAPGTGRTRSIIAAADVFLELLTAQQRDTVQFAFVQQPLATAAHFPGGKHGTMVFTGEQYGVATWSNFPVSDVPRPGLRLGDLEAGQEAAVMHLLQTLLSAKGYRKVLDIMGSDQALSEAGQPFACGRDAYTLAIIGPPGMDEPWMVQFGGHHLALNVIISGEQGVLAPVLTGAQPAIYAAEGGTVRVLSAENDKAFALIRSLDDDQRRQAVIGNRARDLELGPGTDGKAVAPVGLKASFMTGGQRAMLLDLASEWAGMVNDDYAAPRLAEIAAGVNDTFLSWSGPLICEPGHNGASYFRIQGQKVFIEFAPQEVGGDLTMHVHTIYRDPTNDYGRTLLEQV